MVYSAAESTDLSFDPRLHDFQLLDLSFSSMHSSFLWRTDAIVSAK